MANTIDWGKATQNNTNGFGKYQNTIDAASIYEDSYAGETALIGTSAAFSYAKSSYHQDETDPTPTITGTTGGTFSATPSGLSINTSTGTIDLSASTIQPYTITYTVDGVSANFSLSVTASPFISNTFSMQFDSASSQYIDAGNILNFGNGTTDSAFSISAWINMTSTSGFRIFNRYDGSNYEYSFGTGGNNKLQFYIFDTINRYRAIVMTTVLNTGQWYHVAATYSGVGGANAQDGMTIYVDGVPATVTETIAGNYQAMPNLSINAYIGKLNTSYANGKIDEVAIWDTALSSDAVTEIYNATNNNTGKALDLNTNTGNYTNSSSLQYWNRMGD